MAAVKDTPKQKWIIISIALLAVIVFLTFFTDIFSTKQGQAFPEVLWVFIAVTIISALIFIIYNQMKINSSIDNNITRLETIMQSQEKAQAAMQTLEQNIHLGELAKKIAYPKANVRAIREKVFDMIQNHNFEIANAIIAELALKPEYKALAEQLSKQAKSFESASANERQKHLVANIEQLIDEYQWPKASIQIENLEKNFGFTEEAKQLRQKLIDKKNDRKKTLLGLWDEAVKRKATERSLEILKELDPYLTPSEGLALQEAARDAFRNKLHNLGVQFSIAISGKQWRKALDAGQQIMQEFPNSKMAQEIRDSLDVLTERVRESAS